MVKLPKSYKPTKSEKFMNAKQKEYFRTKLKDWKNDIYKESRETVENLQDSIAPADMSDRATQESEKNTRTQIKRQATKISC
jgi:DnaK suppressor protein